MNGLTEDGQALVEDVAARHGFSPEAVTQMLRAVAQGGGTQAQFSHPEFGGMGQWSSGGMTMIGDMFNNTLKARVDALCAELSGALATRTLFQPEAGGASLFVPGSSAAWWPEELGQPAASGSQNDLHYAYFPATRRLAVRIGGDLTVYDTGAHQIGGVSQQQGGDQSVTFTSQMGLVRLADLPVVQDGAAAPDEIAPDVTPAQDEAPAAHRLDPVPAPEPFQPAPAQATPGPVPTSAPVQAAPAAGGEESDAIFAKLEKLAALRDKGILSEEEFTAKKQELLARL
ncbi:SHOCT domain-containing protein [Pseudoponticoccus marisrubri]|uniref:SHOCT domain-containing protein n=1 Tax=Pseudoponticoccus marisrubri TaxID=1685382 RepID=A0A0W7WK52_9RHOB|nr:SHOCT domain-containing protein [Pseudoponticoccus marisrubri]KUF10989.1 hypothetical protein AVJ23_07985 [Pseudoponticoccus marisrubri]